ncbi:MAG TPA: hypothetical protein DD653_05220 [Marinilabiliales bacterium]|jgi:hypothetical protein|nr:hypothetical protein [Marinilabiliales bacterium]
MFLQFTKVLLFLQGLLLLTTQSSYSSNNYIFVEVVTKRLHQQKVVSTTSEILVNTDNGEMIIHYKEPHNFYVFTNKLGEMQVYYPSKNEIMRQQNFLFSSENDPIYQFFSDQSQDLGLSDMGFTLKNSVLEDHYLVTEWIPPVAYMQHILKAILVQEDYLPIYISYINSSEKVKQKIYFSEWNINDRGVYPQRITQIDYITEKDSIISKKSYSNLKIGSEAERFFPKITIPNDAKLVKLSTNQ